MAIRIRYRILTIFCFCAAVVLSADCQQKHWTVAAKPRPGGPDLIVILRHPMDGSIRVKNIGTALAGSSKLTLDCEKVESPSKMYRCPNLPITQMQTYWDPAFPNNATIQVPALAPGAAFSHTLTFWSEFKWPKGTYRFTAVVDAAHTIPESNTKNNIAVSTLTVR